MSDVEAEMVAAVVGDAEMGDAVVGDAVVGEAQHGATGNDVTAGMPRSVDLVLDGSLRPAIRRERGPRFPFPIPDGWFILTPSDEVAVGEIVPVHYFGRDLIVFRTDSGTARVTGAYCSHLGAHIGVGGKVRGESVQCPFHGWCYDGASGRCTKIPYGSGRIPTKAAVSAYPVVERNAMIWAWHHSEGGQPFYEVPEVAELSDPAWSPPYSADFVIRTICQEMAENNHDPAHFRFVHGTDTIPEEEVHIDGSYKRVVGMKGSFVRESFGLGLGVLRMRDAVTFFSSTTPIDEDHVHVRWTFTTPVERGPDGPKRMAESFLAGLSQDIPIWENKRYVERPVLLKNERTILDHREWCKQFYSVPATATH
jgi:nitrite reductase/ring-hydroxylating ferredoxin subunit